MSDAAQPAGKPSGGKNRESQREAAQQKEIELLKQVAFIDLETEVNLRFRQFCEAKGGINIEALKVSAKLVLWPLKAKPEHRTPCIAIPAFNLEFGTLAGIRLYRADGSEFPAYRDGPATKSRLVRGSDGSKAWFIPRRHLLPECTDFTALEGETDVLSVLLDLPVGHLVGTGIDGASGRGKLPCDFLAGKRVNVFGDLDSVGIDGASKFAKKAAKHAKEVRLGFLPGEITENHGKDVRDFVIAGGKYKDLHDLADAGEVVVPSEEPPKNSRSSVIQVGTIANFGMGIDTTSSSRETKAFPLSMSDILAQIRSATDGWPRRVGSALFCHDAAGSAVSTGDDFEKPQATQESQEPAVPEITEHPPTAIHWLTKPASLFGWLGSRCPPPPQFKCAEGYHTREEVFAEQQRTAMDYDTIELFPHEPPMSRTYYATQFPPAGDGTTLAALLDRFSFDSDVDRELALAAAVTPGWGGPGGSRPIFGVTADDRGFGKTTVVKMISRIWGGVLEISLNETAKELKERLLSPDGRTRRIAVVDNVKTRRLSWADLEAMNTAGEISGKAMYIGEATRPNTITWFITLNGVSFSTDIAQRTVVFKVRKPQFSGNWESDTSAFIDANRWKIIGDIIGFLRRPATPLAKHSRRGTWDEAVLSRLSNPAAAQALIAERQVASDAESDESDTIEDHFADQLRKCNYSPTSDVVFIPSPVAARWIAAALGERFTTTAANRDLHQRIAAGNLPRLIVSNTRTPTRGRGYIWLGVDADPWSTPNGDLEARINFNLATKYQTYGAGHAE